ncbi:MAG: nucleotidyl transferase AbiEii/AbiGii toxin family protein [Ghiorsea sp.]
MFIQRLIKSLHTHEVNYALVGGYAVALHGAVRGTMDIDLVIQIDELSFSQVEKAMTKIGLQPRLPVTASDVFHFREEYIKNRNMIAWSFVNPNNPTEMVDIIITENLSSLESVTKQAFGLNIQVLSIKDLIAMKRKAGRPQDVEDVKVLEQLS